MPLNRFLLYPGIFLLDADSAPGPDGYSRRFYQSCWEVICSEAAVQEFFAGVPLPKSVASGLIVLIPKRR